MYIFSYIVLSTFFYTCISMIIYTNEWTDIDIDSDSKYVYFSEYAYCAVSDLSFEIINKKSNVMIQNPGIYTICIDNQIFGQIRVISHILYHPKKINSQTFTDINFEYQKWSEGDVLGFCDLEYKTEKSNMNVYIDEENIYNLCFYWNNIDSIIFGEILVVNNSNQRSLQRVSDIQMSISGGGEEIYTASTLSLKTTYKTVSVFTSNRNGNGFVGNYRVLSIAANTNNGFKHVTVTEDGEFIDDESDLDFHGPRASCTNDLRLCQTNRIHMSDMRSVFVTDKHRAIRIDPNSQTGLGNIADWFGTQDSEGGGRTGLNSPMGIAASDTHVYVVDSGNHRIVVLKRSNMSFVDQYGVDSISSDSTGFNAGFSAPNSIDFTEYPLPSVWVTDTDNQRLVGLKIVTVEKIWESYPQSDCPGGGLIVTTNDHKTVDQCKAMCFEDLTCSCFEFTAQDSISSTDKIWHGICELKSSCWGSCGSSNGAVDLYVLRREGALTSWSTHDGLLLEQIAISPPYLAVTVISDNTLRIIQLPDSESGSVTEISSSPITDMNYSRYGKYRSRSLVWLNEHIIHSYFNNNAAKFTDIYKINTSSSTIYININSTLSNTNVKGGIRVRGGKTNIRLKLKSWSGLTPDIVLPKEAFNSAGEIEWSVIQVTGTLAKVSDALSEVTILGNYEDIYVIQAWLVTDDGANWVSEDIEMKPSGTVTSKCVTVNGDICNGQGSCSKYGCICNEPWFGVGCENKICKPACLHGGVCDNGICICTSGRDGEICENVQNCPGCSGHPCDHSTGSCRCGDGYTGRECQLRKCPIDVLGRMCGLHGSCDYTTGICQCSVGYFGGSCSMIGCSKTRQQIFEQESGTLENWPCSDCENGECKCALSDYSSDCAFLPCSSSRGRPGTDSKCNWAPGEKGMCDYNTGQCHCTDGSHGWNCAGVASDPDWGVIGGVAPGDWVDTCC
eukprot:GHVL01015108.1.p1 GENE.GHVL01015108.1~~GHVL01015108.1.p1  ORF type:complete len:954 (-),score=207.11 GHVL01015108.1:1301-4162(-)